MQNRFGNGLVIAKTLAVGFVGGYLLTLVGFPLAWLLGSLLAVQTFKIFFKRQKVHVPYKMREFGLPAFGYVMGVSLDAETGRAMLAQVPIMIGAAIVVAAVAVVLSLMLLKFTSFSYNTCLLGTIPGGITQMLSLCDEFDEIDYAAVSFMQIVRVLMVLIIIPFYMVINGAVMQPAVGDSALAMLSPRLYLCIAFAYLGGFIAKKLHLPTGYMLGAAIIITILNLAGMEIVPLPNYLIIAAQVVFGTHMGVSTSLEDAWAFRKNIPHIILNGFLLICGGIVVGYFVSLIGGVDQLTAFLCTAPGGQAEMLMMAVSIDGDVACVTAYQFVRVISMLAFSGPLARAVSKRVMKKKEQQPV